MSKKDLVSEEVLQELINKIQEIVNNYCWNLEYFTDSEVDDFFQASADEVTFYNGLINDKIESQNFLWSSKHVAEKIALLVKNSSGHWNYVGSSDYSYIAVGVTYESGVWYCDIAMAMENSDNK